MSILVSGSLAYDTTLTHEGRFDDNIVATDLEHINLTFQASAMRRDYGGCGGNIAYGLKLLGEDPIVISALGADGRDYIARLDSLGIKHSLFVDSSAFSGHCFITVDALGNQLCTFAPNVSLNAGKAPWPEKATIEWAILAPETRDAMLVREKQFVDRAIPFVLDLGQTIPLFTGEEIIRFIVDASFVTVNSYEFHLMQKRTGFDARALTRLGSPFVVTQGENGVIVYDRDKELSVPAVPVKAVNVVGAGDAFRAGLLYGLNAAYSLKNTLELACTLASFKVEADAPQKYAPSRDAIRTRLQTAYGKSDFFL